MIGVGEFLMLLCINSVKMLGIFNVRKKKEMER